MIGAGAEVGHHHEALDARLRGGIDHPDRGVAVDGVGPRRITATRAGGEDDRVVPGEQLGQRVGVESLDVGDDGLGARGGDVAGVVGIAEDRCDRVAAVGQDVGQL